MAYDTNVPKPKNQGGHAGAPTQGAAMQSKKSPADPMPSKILYNASPKGFGGSKKA